MIKYFFKIGTFVLLCLKTTNILAHDYVMTYSDTLMLNGEQMYRDKDFLAAILYLDSCIQLNPRNDQCRFTRAKIALEMKKYVMAKYYFQSVLAITPEDAVAWNLLGLCYTEMSHYDSAEFCYKNSIAIDASNSKFYANWAKNEYLIGDYDHAEKLYGTAIFLEPNYANHHKNLAEVLLKVNRKQEAIASIEKAASIDPKNMEIINLKNTLSSDSSSKNIALTGLTILGLGLFLFLIVRKSKKAKE